MAAKAHLGFVGIGRMGRDLLKEALASGKAYAVALCDRSPEALEAARAIAGDEAAVYHDYEAMLAAGGFDGVVVATPQYLHAEMSMAALRAGYHVFTEKPMGMNVRECARMLEVAKQTGKGLMVGQVLRYITIYRYILELAKSGELGRAVAMRVIRTMGWWSNGTWLEPWRLKRETCGGIIPEVNIHEIDLMLNILGEATAVDALGAQLVNFENDYEDYMSVHIAFGDGGIGSVTSACCDYLGQNAGEILFEKGTVYYSSLAGELRIRRRGEDMQVIPTSEVGKDWENGVRREMREFAEACLGEHPVTIPGEEGLRAVEVCEAAYLSAHQRQRIILPLPRE